MGLLANYNNKNRCSCVCVLFSEETTACRNKKFNKKSSVFKLFNTKVVFVFLISFFKLNSLCVFSENYMVPTGEIPTMQQLHFYKYLNKAKVCLKLDFFWFSQVLLYIFIYSLKRKCLASLPNGFVFLHSIKEICQLWGVTLPSTPPLPFSLVRTLSICKL